MIGCFTCLSDVLLAIEICDRVQTFGRCCWVLSIQLMTSHLSYVYGIKRFSTCLCYLEVFSTRTQTIMHIWIGLGIVWILSIPSFNSNMTSTYSYQCKVEEDWYAIKRVTMQLASGFLCPPPSSNHEVNWIWKMKSVACCKWLFVLVYRCPRFGSIWFHLPNWWHPTCRSLFGCLYLHGLRCFFVFLFLSWRIPSFGAFLQFHVMLHNLKDTQNPVLTAGRSPKVKNKFSAGEPERSESFWKWLRLKSGKIPV